MVNDNKYPSEAERLIRARRFQYFQVARANRYLYYATRMVAGLSAAVLPFFVIQGFEFHWLAVGLSLAIAVATVFDQVFNPKDRWILYSKALALITLAQIKSEGDYEKNKEAIDTIINTQMAALQQVAGLKELVQHVDEVSRGAVRGLGAAGSGSSEGSA